MTNSDTPVNSTPLWNDDLIRRYDLSGPRYTSYPTAPQFHTEFALEHWESAVERSNSKKPPISLYFHIPFCDTVCYYCGCNKVITANKGRAIPYLNALKREIAMQAEYIDTSRPVDQLHWGGGTPTYINDAQMTDLMDCIEQHFPLHKDDSGEYSIEIHPQTVNPERMAHLRKLGFNRVSLGIQDFNPDVQKAVNRFNSEEEVAAIVKACKDFDFKSLSMDLIYGLPKQTIKSFAETLDKVIEMRPSRLSLFNYAHMPHIFKVQKQIDTTQLPEPQDKLQILQNSINQLVDAGYVYIGMDHFALPDDELAIAQKEGVLNRNFQGYATHGGCDLFAFGVSSINSVDNTFSQNHKDVNLYIESLENNKLPITKGIELNQDDLIRRSVINQLICHFDLDFSVVEKQWGIVFGEHFEKEVIELKDLAQDGLIKMTNNAVQVSNTGRLLIRRVCMIFDAYLVKPKNDDKKEAVKYSRII